MDAEFEENGGVERQKTSIFSTFLIKEESRVLWEDKRKERVPGLYEKIDTQDI